MGCIHVYSGEGKGKTSAAFGAALRAFGHGHRVCIAQFLKHTASGEARAWQELSSQAVRLLGRPRRVGSAFTEADAEAAQEGWAEITAMLLAGEHRLVVLDELCVVLGKGLLPLELALPVLLVAREKSEIIITGRFAPDELIHAADLYTRFDCQKHYAATGLPPRPGVEF